MDYERWVIKKYQYWVVYLHAGSPQYLGRVYIWLNRDIIDLMDISRDEWHELKIIGQAVKRALYALFQPDHYNWSALGNTTPHCHVHVVPRYRSTREFDGVTFTDKNPEGNYSPYDKGFSVPEATLEKLRNAIKTAMTP